jgi:hypothetical protein
MLIGELLMCQVSPERQATVLKCRVTMTASWIDRLSAAVPMDSQLNCGNHIVGQTAAWLSDLIDPVKRDDVLYNNRISTNPQKSARGP